jgi:hypothetical protein
VRKNNATSEPRGILFFCKRAILYFNLTNEYFSMAIKPEYFDMNADELAAAFEAEGKCRHGIPKEERCEECISSGDAKKASAPENTAKQDQMTWDNWKPSR